MHRKSIFINHHSSTPLLNSSALLVSF